MKKIVLSVLALVAVAIANEEEEKGINFLAEKYETDVETIKTCFEEAETNIMEIHAAQKKWMEMKSVDELDEETKKAVLKRGRFLACILEAKDMMKDSKLVPDKILESIDSEQTKNIPSKEDLTECINDLNEDNDLSKEDRALGLLVCFMNDQEIKGEK